MKERRTKSKEGQQGRLETVRLLARMTNRHRSFRRMVPTPDDWHGSFHDEEDATGVMCEARVQLFGGAGIYRVITVFSGNDDYSLEREARFRDRDDLALAHYFDQIQFINCIGIASQKMLMQCGFGHL